MLLSAAKIITAIDEDKDIVSEEPFEEDTLGLRKVPLLYSKARPAYAPPYV